VTIDLDRVREGWGEVTVPVSAFYEGCRPLIDRTARVVEQLLASRADGPIETLYVTGGGSELPAVARVLKESFGRSVRRSSYMRSATAIGLAIGADARSGYRLRDRFTRHFGVWREAEHGRKVAFDVLFPRGLGLPAPGAPAHRVLRSYAPAHNVGCFRYVEASHLDADGEPVGDLTFWDEIQFPFDPGLRDVADLSLIAVERERRSGPVPGGRGVLVRCGRHAEGENCQPLGRLQPGVCVGTLVGKPAAVRRTGRGAPPPPRAA
jgi:hypothetical protein